MNKKNSEGQVMLISTLLFVVISLSTIFTLSATSLFSSRDVAQNGRSLSTYYTAESGEEDILYRMQSGRQTPNSSTLSLNGATTTVTVTNLSAGEKQVLSSGTENNEFRKIITKVSTSVGVSFNYGVQVGTGGVFMGGNSGVIGNIYANGDIKGLNGAYVTGTAVAANSPALFSSEANDSPASPPSSIIFGKVTNSQDAAESFSSATTSPVNKIDLYLRKTGSPGNITVRLVADKSGAPDDVTLTSKTLLASSVTGSYGWITINFSDTPDLIASSTYWIVLDSGVSSTNYYTWGANDTYGNGGASSGVFDGSWSAVSPVADGYFRLYQGGVVSSIDNIDVGTSGTGDARAHTITNSSIAGVAYCQTGSGNNKTCDTSQSDPGPQDFPISQANIEAWESDASIATTTGSVSINNNGSQTIGPRHITGNLSLDNGSTLTVSGTIWVDGTISVSNNSIVKLSSSYGGASGVIIANGNIFLENGTQFQGSGTAGSYLLLISNAVTQSDPTCSGPFAIDLSNNAGAVILYAPNGSMHLTNGAGVNEATAGMLCLDNNATVTYESGLANMFFSSGPGGSWKINSWNETQ